MPLSEHEQRMLDQIESALYAEDPKFASNVRVGRLRGASGRRGLRFAALFISGLAMLIVGVAVPAVQIGGFPILSVVGFVVMFCAAAYLITSGGNTKVVTGAAAAPLAAGSQSVRGVGRPGKSIKKNGMSSGFSARMEARFRKRFDNE